MNDVYGLMREFIHILILNRPEDPVAFLHRVLGERMASNGGDPATGNPPEHKPAEVATDAAMLRVQVEYSGCKGMRRRNFSTLVASASPMARSRAQAQATGAISSLLWGASSPRAQAEPTTQQSSVNAAVLAMEESLPTPQQSSVNAAVPAAVLAVEESLLAYWMMRGAGEAGDASIAAFFRK